MNPRTVSMTPKRESLYKEARAKAQQIVDICDSILESHATEARACRDADFSVDSFRHFCKSDIGGKKDGKPNKEDEWEDWREEFLYRLTGERIPAPDDFDEVFEDVCSTELSDTLRKVIQGRIDGLTFEEIDKMLGVKNGRARQLENKAIRRLHRPGVTSKLMHGYDFVRILNEFCDAGDECRGIKREYDDWLKAREIESAKREAKLEEMRQGTEEYRAESRKMRDAMTASPNTSLEYRMIKVPLDELGLSTRSYNSLERYYFYNKNHTELTALDVAQLPMIELMKIQNVGYESIKDIVLTLIERFCNQQRK